ncbi:hypothetical protein MKW92_003011, partial [Papaver armeniacum]
VTKYGRWTEVASVLNFTSKVGSPSVQLQDLYESLLYHFELNYCTGIQRKLNEPSGPLFFPSNLVEKSTTDGLSCFNELPAGKKKPQAYPPEFPRDMDDPEKLHGLLDQCIDSSAKQFANAPSSLICFSGSDSNPVGLQNRGDPDGVPPYGSNLSQDAQKKDRNAPKKPRTAYQIFIGAECGRLKKIPAQSLGLNYRQRAIEAWNRLNDRGRMPYIEVSNKERERFRQEMAAYTERQIGQAGKTAHGTELEFKPSTSNSQTTETSNGQLNAEYNVSTSQTAETCYVEMNGEYHVSGTSNSQTANTSNAQMNSECHVPHTSNIQTEETSHAQQSNDEYHVSLQLEEPDKLPEPDESMLELAFKMMENANKYDTPFQIDLGEFLSVP